MVINIVKQCRYLNQSTETAVTIVTIKQELVEGVQ